MTRFFLMICLIYTSACSKPKLNPLQSQFSLYCDYVTELVDKKETVSKNPKKILIAFGKILPKLSQEFKFIINTQSVMLRERRYKSFIFLGRKVFENQHWDCPAYQYFSLNYIK